MIHSHSLRFVFALAAILGAIGAMPSMSLAADKHLREVHFSKNSGYIIVEQGTAAQSQLGLDNAPYVDSSDALNLSCNGIDSIAFVFDKNGVLAKPPVYISDFGLDAISSYYISRFKGLTVGKSTRESVHTLFGELVPDRSSPLIAYVKVTTYNPFSRNNSGRN